MDTLLNDNIETHNEHRDRGRFGDFSELLQTAWPLMLSTGLFSITLFIDRLFLYQFSDAAAAAAMSAGTLSWSVTCLPVGICGYTNTFVSQYLGIKRLDKAIQLVWQGILMALATVPVLVTLGIFSYRIFRASGHSHELAASESEFFFWLVPGACSTIISAALIGLFAGSGRTMVLLYCDAVATALNCVLDYGLIFGNLGMPRLQASPLRSSCCCCFCSRFPTCVAVNSDNFPALFHMQGRN
jgi:MATE family multidrug resistance protein